MKRLSIILTLLFGTITVSFGQIKNSNGDINGKKTIKSCQRPIENKSIQLCKIKKDTLTYNELKKCGELTINDNNKQFITSYLLRYMLPDSTAFIEYKGTDNKISITAISEIISSNIKAVIIEEIIGIEGKENIVLGHRWFYFR